MKQVKRSLFFITLPLCAIGCFAFTGTVRAQEVTSDGTLPSPTTVNPDGNNFTINGGTQVGGNLFHSFREFSVPNGGEAFFNNAQNIQNIISRVTGGSFSDINGLIRANGSANLFLLNPAGIIFGPNARLQIGGSFLASTASSLLFNNGLEEFKVNPQESSLLSINIPTGLRFRDNPQPIRVQASGQSEGLGGATGSFSNPTLAVNPGQTLALVGGNVSLEGGVLQAPGGQIELGGLAAEGTVGFNLTGNNFNFPVNVVRADVVLNQAAGINVITNDQSGGSININARNIDISGESLLTAGVALDSGTSNTTPGDIKLNATGETGITQSRIENNLNSNSLAKSSGNIDIIANTLSLKGAELDTTTFGTRNNTSDLAGNITLNANNKIEIDGANITSTSQYPTAETDKFSKIILTAAQGSISLKNNAEINATNTNTGFAGDIVISALEEVSLANSTILSQGNQGLIFIGKNNSYTQAISPKIVNFDNSTLSTTNSGINNADAVNTSINAGDISIDAKNRISLVNKSKIEASTERTGNAGNIRLQVENGQISFEGSDTLVRSRVEPGVTGDGGKIDINISNGSLLVNSGALLSTTTFGTRNAQKQDAGNVNITVGNGDVQLNNGIIFSQVREEAVGDGGNIKIDILNGSLLMTDDANLITSTYGTGKAGNVVVNAQNGSISLKGGSDIFSTIERGGNGNGGDITITAGSLLMTDDAGLIASTSGTGKAGNVVVNAQNGSVSLKGASNIFSNVEAEGDGEGGEIKITARSLSLENGSQLQTIVRNGAKRGNAGSITIVATEDVTFAGQNGTIPSGSRSNVQSNAPGNAGNIDIQARLIFIRDGAAVTTENGSSGLAGKITLTAGDKIDIVGGSTITSTANNNIIITPDIISSINIAATKGSVLLDNSEISATNSGTGLAGNITINASDQVSIVNGTEISSNGNDGRIFIGTSVTNPPSSIPNSVNIDNSELSTTNSNSNGLAGIIELNSRDLIFINRSTIKSDGNAGDITINARSLSLTNRGTLSANSGDSVGNPAAGDITVTTIKDILLDNEASIRAQTTGGKGNITLNARDLILRRNSDIKASATGSANGGDININVPRGFIIATPRQDSDIIANATGGGKGGNITITTLGLFGIAEFKRSDTNRNSNNNNTNDIDASSDFGLQGTVNINTPDVDPSQGLVELPETVIDPTQQVAQNPCQRGVRSTFVISGRGGVPSSPNQAISSDNVRVDLVQPVASTGSSNSVSTKKPSTSATVKQIVPAQGWIFNEKGEVVLTAYDPTRTGSQRNWQKPASCAVR